MVVAETDAEIEIAGTLVACDEKRAPASVSAEVQYSNASTAEVALASIRI